MVVINTAEKGIGTQIKKKLGQPTLYGEREYGKLRYGESDKFYGIYQIRATAGGQVVVKEKFYTPTNRQTAPQQANRSKLADAVLAWQALTDDQKEGYNKKAKYKSLSGYNLYLSEYLLSH